MPVPIAVPNEAPAVFVTLIAVTAAYVSAVNVSNASPDTLTAVAPAEINDLIVDAAVEELILRVV